VQFPSLKAPRLLAILMREPLSYRVERQKGSHRRLTSSAGYPSVTFSWHDRATIPGGLVKEILTERVGLSESDAFRLL
jgi:predicted RNA binding protein YcfA (HicA-like mRNA interferase family)